MSLSTRPGLHQEFTFLEQSPLIPRGFTLLARGVLSQDRGVLIRYTSPASCMHESAAKIKRHDRNTLP